MNKFRAVVLIALFGFFALCKCSTSDSQEGFGLDSLEFFDPNRENLKLFRGRDFIYEDTLSHGIFIKILRADKENQITELSNPKLTMYTDSGAVNCAPMNFLSSIMPDASFYFNVDMKGRIMFYTEDKLLFLERTSK